ncbi:MAG TPA: PP2C family serine/threonine-protein phosphatase [Ktedonobacterales bacterium]|nr:PP2C family serine/threonine-protein phosphatase [Ktedonobacterales bacterium]
MALRLVAVTCTDTGLQREQNEDACFAKVSDEAGQPAGLFIVADGMGGYHAGEVASQLAVETIRDALLPLIGPPTSQPTVRLDRKKRGKGAKTATAEPDTSDPAAATEASEDKSADISGGAHTRHLEETPAIEHYAESLRSAIERSSEVIVRYGRQHPDSQGLGSTVTAALVVGNHAFIGNVGDSRTYLWRDKSLQQVTRDHSLVAQLVELGQIEPDEAYDHPKRNLIYRSLGAGRADVEVDIFAQELKAGDALLLASDGLWEMVRDPQITSILSAGHDAERTCSELVERANENGGEDNITAVLIRCDEA